MSNDKTREALAVWREVAEAAPAMVGHPDRKFLLLSEAACVRLGAALEAAAAPSQASEPPTVSDDVIASLVASAWRHGWERCRDAEFVGDGAQDAEWGYCSANVVEASIRFIANQTAAAPEAPAQAVQGEPVAWLIDWPDEPDLGHYFSDGPCNTGRSTPLYTATPAQADGLATCNCRWRGDEQVQHCTLHQAHVDAIHEWAERAKDAEQKLAARNTQPEA